MVGTAFGFLGLRLAGFFLGRWWGHWLIERKSSGGSVDDVTVVVVVVVVMVVVVVVVVVIGGLDDVSIVG